MYVAQTDACTVPNSATPVTPNQIANAAQTYMDTNAIVAKALATFTSVLNRPDLNRNGLLLADSGGVPTAPFAGFRAWPDWTEGNPSGAPPACLREIPLPLSIPIDTRQAVAVKAPLMVPQTIEGRAIQATGKPPTTGNVCIDLQKGYALQSQVSAAMLFKCSKAGYSQMGLKPTAAQVLAFETAGTLPQIPDQDVPNYDPSMGMAQLPSGFAGLAFWGSLGLIGATIWLAREWSKTGKR